MVGVTVSVMKGGGNALLRHYGCCALPTGSGSSCTSVSFAYTASYYRCLVKATTMSGGPLSLDRFSVNLHNHNHNHCHNRKCTTQPGFARSVSCMPLEHAVASPSSIPEASSADGAGNMETIKNAANSLDIRVGRILRAWKHEEADSLYVEEVDIGEPQPRLICSGLVNYISLYHLQDKKVVVLANLKPRNMRGVKSFGMLMAASDLSHENVELLEPPEISLPGERVWFGDEDEKENLPDAASPNQIQKKKVWELVQPHLKTNASCVAVLGGYFMRTSAGMVRCGSLKDANIS